MTRTVLDAAYDVGAAQAQTDFYKEAGKLDFVRRAGGKVRDAAYGTVDALQSGLGRRAARKAGREFDAVTDAIPMKDQVRAMKEQLGNWGKDHAGFAALPFAGAVGAGVGGGLDVEGADWMTGGIAPGLAAGLGTSALFKGLNMKGRPAGVLAALVGSGAALASNASGTAAKGQDQMRHTQNAGALDVLRHNMDRVFDLKKKTDKKRVEMFGDYTKATKKYQGDLLGRIQGLLAKE